YADKTPEIVAATYDVARQNNSSAEILFYGEIDAAQLREKLGPLAPQLHYLPKLSDETPSPEAYLDGFQDWKNAPAFVVGFKSEGSPVIPLMHTIRTRGKRVWASSLWDDLCAGRTDDRALDDPDANWGWLIDKGANILCTDRPEELLQYLRKKRLHD